MENALWMLLALVLATAGVAWVNRRHEARRAGRPPTGDEHVAAAWEELDFDDQGAGTVAFNQLLSLAPVEALGSKTAVSRMAVMALRAGRHDLLPSLASRADTLGAGCGEARALGVLAAAWRGDMDVARRMYAASQQAMAGCASCGAEASVKILLQEAAGVLDAVDQDERVTVQGHGASV